MAQDFDEFLQLVAEQARAGAGIEDGAELDEHRHAEAAAGVAVADVVRTISVPVKAGHGELTSGKQTTFGVTIKGTGTIVAPPNGTWNITVKDLVAGKTVFQSSGLPANKPVTFSYKTGFQAQLKVVADWSEGGDTTLDLKLDTNL